MAGLSGLPAMEIDPVGFGARNNLLQSQGAEAQAQAALAQQDLQTKSQLAPIAVQEAKEKSQLEQMAAGNETLAQVAKDASAADPEDAPDVWDRGMKQAAENGVSLASQYVGHYRPDLAERVGDVYGGGQGQTGTSKLSPTGATQDQQSMDRAVASMPPPQLQQALGNLNRVITSFNNVKDQASWQSELDALKQGGIDVTRFLPSMDWNPMNYAAASRVIKSLVPYRDAMLRRATLLASGATPPAPAALGTSTFIGTEPKTQRPVYHNPVTGQDTVGTTPVGPKPSSAMSTFLLKQQAWLSDHPGDAGGALEFANGRKAMPPERLQAIALEQANRELGDAVLAGANIPNTDAWVRQKAAENFQLLTSAAASSSPAPGGGGHGAALPGLLPPGSKGAPPPPQGGLPARALDVLRGSGGKPVRFNNGYVYRLGPDGKPVYMGYQPPQSASR